MCIEYDETNEDEQYDKSRFFLGSSPLWTQEKASELHLSAALVGCDRPWLHGWRA
jgi:hypothetical protein